MEATVYIDERIAMLVKLRERAIAKGNIHESGQLWARIVELKAFKVSFSDRDGNWII